MSCNGCRVLRKGCSEECMLRHCLQWIENPQGQAHATLFVAKFFGRAALMSFLSSVPANQRSALFQSLLYEAVGRTINPVNGAVGLLWTGNWHLCQMGVEKVLRGGASLTPLPHFLGAHQQNQVTDVETVMLGGATCHQLKKPRVGTRTPSEESETSTLRSRAEDCAPHAQSQRKLLPLFF
ncbi:LOB domain-containing protein 38 [Cajanus cajan]|uniref:LOB domain-containing protein 38 n=1 Tax=Cajanus cajan TaxID=3821 RepID=A0A151U7M2_CAJCA|nr:LOB domain-containing protein 38 [Cajanus cajan]KYP75294.1 LOB domain-containing protein 38 [Cajanus cajan]